VASIPLKSGLRARVCEIPSRQRNHIPSYDSIGFHCDSEVKARFAVEISIWAGFGDKNALMNSADFNHQIVKDKANHAVVLDKATSDKLQKDVQSYRLITVAVLVDRLKINGSLARQALKDLEEAGTIKKVVGHSRMLVYSEFPGLRTMTDKILRNI
jgi:small subunit ribosomal protein S25e